MVFSYFFLYHNICLAWSRYLDLDRANWDWGATVLGTYNVIGKALLLILTLLCILVVRAGIVEYHHLTKDSLAVSYMLLIPCVFITAIIMAFDHHESSFSFIGSAYIFSRVSESVAIAPQILLFARLQGASRVVATYISALGVYRLLYIFNWAWYVHHCITTYTISLQYRKVFMFASLIYSRRYHQEGHFEKFAFWCGIVQFGLLTTGVGLAVCVVHRNLPF